MNPSLPDLGSLAHQVVTNLSPYLPLLVAGARELGKGAAGEAGKKLTQAGLDRARQLWDRVHPALASNADAQNAIRIAAARPGDPRALGPLEMQLEDVLKADPMLAQQLSVTVIEINQSRRGGIDFTGGDNRIGRDAIGGDRHGDDYRAERDLYVFKGERPESPPASLREFYLRKLAAACAELPFGILDPRFSEATGAHPLTVNDIYIDLDVMAPAARDDQGSFLKRIARRLEAPPAGSIPDRVPILDALARPDLSRVVLLGEMGSGKSTFVQYMTYALAQIGRGTPNATALLPENSPLASLLPVWLVLREAARHIPLHASRGTADMIWNAIRAELVERMGTADGEAFLPELRAAVRDRPSLLLFDGLDEVPEAEDRRAHLLQAISDFCSGLKPTSRVLVTARPYAYADPAWRLARFETLTLAPFDEDQIERFIRRWYSAVAPALTWSQETADGKANELREALAARPDLADIASRPLLLTLMATLSASWGTLPNDRFGLYEDMVELLLSRWQRARMIRDEDGRSLTDPGIEKTLKLDQKTIRKALHQLAFQAHTRQGASRERPTEPADIIETEVIGAFAPLVDADTNPRNVLRYLNTRAGLLSSRKPGVYAFPHRSFQEYLSACHIGEQVGSAGMLSDLVRADADWWRETALWAAGRTNIDGVISIVNCLVPETPDRTPDRTDADLRAAVLAGMILDQAADKPVEAPAVVAVRRRVVEWLVMVLERGELKPPERAEAGRVLAWLGDPRPGIFIPILKPRQLHVPRLLWCEVPPGSFPLGNIKQTDPEAYDSEMPRVEYAKLNYHYFLSRYPVTNAQFDAFVKDPDGYHKDEWWTAAGLEWRGARISPDKRRWGWGPPNYPIVDVTWYEAHAFARWLNQRWGESGAQLEVWRPGVDAPFPAVSLTPEYHVRLPTEAEWEKAASWDARRKIKSRYSWGNDPDPNRANYDDTGIGLMSAVGCFPTGASPCGALDMSGNVWEWCVTSWVKSYLDPSGGNNSSEGDDARVVRGGSFLNESRLVRCASRINLNPAYFHLNVGFRVCVAPAAP